MARRGLFGPARPPGLLVQLLRRLVDPRVYLKAVMLVGFLGLVLLPTLADLTNAVLKPVASEDGTCRIVNVIDGDTVTLMCQEQGLERARILGFDTPEKYAPKCVAEFVAAEKATWALRTLIQQAERIELERDGADQYGRTLVRLILDGQDVAGRMIRAGHARNYSGGPRGSWC
ncbi:thermonuclease family protein [Tabrizicola sp.]|uniref:thermonuclease family protein n=1 Tax=Tabrizicola sp. TaxID=2005166 RepID=UPI003F36DDC9